MRWSTRLDGILRPYFETVEFTQVGFRIYVDDIECLIAMPNWSEGLALVKPRSRNCKASRQSRGSAPQASCLDCISTLADPSPSSPTPSRAFLPSLRLPLTSRHDSTDISLAWPVTTIIYSPCLYHCLSHIAIPLRRLINANV
jgi:hypothetical protein